MNKPLLTKFVDQYKYEVHPDLDYTPFQDQFDEEYGNEICNRLYDGDLNAYGVVKYKVCECCNMWSECDSIWGVLDTSADNALNEFISCYGGE